MYCFVPSDFDNHVSDFLVYPYSRGVTKTQTLKTQKKRFILLISISYHPMFYGHAMFISNSQKEARYLSCPVLSLSRRSSSEKLTRFKNSSRYFTGICWRIFYRRGHRVAIMLFKLKSVLCPPDATAINWRI